MSGGDVVAAGTCHRSGERGKPGGHKTIDALPQPPARDCRSRKHSAKTIALARRMYGNGDSWTPTQIQSYFAERGLHVARSTIRAWVVEEDTMKRRERDRLRYRREQGGGMAPALSVEDRIVQLREGGLSHAAISKVVALDFGVELSRTQVHHRLVAAAEGRKVKQYRKRKARVAA